MANENKLFRTNDFKVVGTLVSAEVTAGNRSSDGAAYISVDATVTSVIDGKTNEYQIGFYANQLTQEGKTSKLYETYSKLPELINKKVEISGEIRENRFWSKNAGQLVSTQLLSGKWVKGVAVTTVDEGTFSLGGFVAKSIIEKRNKEDEIYRYDVTIAQSNYNGDNMNVFTIHVDPNDREIVAGVEGYQLGDTVKLIGKLAFYVETVTVEDKNSGFGAPMTRTFTNKQRNFYITSGSNPLSDESAYDQDAISKLSNAYKAKDIELANNAKLEAPAAPVTNAAPVSKRQTSLI